jgi:glycosyltransferase involved in cell wall biosynthesis
MSNESRPVVAWIANSLPPYRLYSFRRIVHEIPEVEFWSLFTHGPGKSSANLQWKQDYPSDIRPVVFHAGEPIPQRFLLSTALLEWRKGKRMIQWLKQHQVRAVIVGGYNDLGKIRVIRWCGRKGIPCFISADSNNLGDPPSGFRAAMKRFLLRSLLHSCAGVMPFGSRGKDYFRRYGVTEHQMFLVPCESDFLLFDGTAVARNEHLCQIYGLEASRKRLVYSGRLVDVKRVDLLIDAFVALTASRPNWDLLIIGDGPLRKPLQNRIPAELQSRVQWKGFVEEPALLADLYRCCDALVLPSDVEPWGIVITEAAAAGLAIVASSVVGAAQDLVQHGVNGILFPVGQSAPLLEALFLVTDEHKIDGFRSASPQIFKRWRTAADPIEGLRQALAFAGVIDKQSANLQVRAIDD